MRFLLRSSVALLAGIATSSAMPLNRAPALDVKLTAIGNTKIKVVITNTGSSSYRLLADGTFLDRAPVKKFHVSTSNHQVAFEGIKKRILLNGLNNDVFVTVGVGKSVELYEDVASVHDLSSGGVFKVQTKGLIPFAEEGSTDLKGTISYHSNTLAVNVDGQLAAAVNKAVKLDKRSIVSDCSAEQLKNATDALQLCSTLATTAATAALTGSATKFSEYFGTASSAVRQTVSDRLSAVAKECASSPLQGVTTLHCVDSLAYCGGSTLAYTVPGQNYIVYCPLYFSSIPLISTTCHAQDQATTSLHEFTHAPAVYAPATDDYAYGYSDATSLPQNQEVLNADSYALYANALYSGC